MIKIIVGGLLGCFLCFHAFADSVETAPPDVTPSFGSPGSAQIVANHRLVYDGSRTVVTRFALSPEKRPSRGTADFRYHRVTYAAENQLQFQIAWPYVVNMNGLTVCELYISRGIPQCTFEHDAIYSSLDEEFPTRKWISNSSSSTISGRISLQTGGLVFGTVHLSDDGPIIIPWEI